MGITILKKLDEKILLELRMLNSQRIQGDWMSNDERYMAIRAEDIEGDNLWVSSVAQIFNKEKGEPLVFTT